MNGGAVKAARLSGHVPRSTLWKITVRNYLATISRSSMLKTKVAPGLMRGGRPLSR